MRVRVRLFAGLREAVGRQEIEVDAREGSTVSDLRDLLSRELPALAPLMPSLVFALRDEYCSWDDLLHDGDEVALIPPLSGGGLFQVTGEPLDSKPLIDLVSKDESGAVVVFLGTVRGENEGRSVRYLEYEAYTRMAEKEMRKIGEEMKARWPLTGVAMRHRTGRLEAGETAVIIAVSAAHRGEAFEACRFAIDRMKETVPIWKKEVWEGGETWVQGQTASQRPGASE